MALFHICTKGFNDRIIFRDKHDFIQGINKTALSFYGHCKLAAVCFMSNHVHFIANGNEKAASEAIVKFKKTYSMYFSGKYGDNKIFRRWPHSIIKCNDSDYIREAISYVYKNPVGHSETNNPFYYPWSSIHIHFHPTSYTIPDKYIEIEGKVSEIHSLKQWEKRRILHTHINIPDSWVIDSNGMVTFNSFVDKSIVEELFKTERNFNFFIQKREKDDFNRSFIRLDMEEEHLCCDNNALKKARQISNAIFGTEDIYTLDTKQKNELMLHLTINHGTPQSIASRILGIKR